MLVASKALSINETEMLENALWEGWREEGMEKTVLLKHYEKAKESRGKLF